MFRLITGILRVCHENPCFQDILANIHIISIEKFLGHSQKLSAFRRCNENSVFCLIPLIILVDRCTVDRRKVYDL